MVVLVLIQAIGIIVATAIAVVVILGTRRGRPVLWRRDWLLFSLPGVCLHLVCQSCCMRPDLGLYEVVF